MLLDVGCGPGMATRALAKYFDATVGSDAGESMIQIAKELGGETAKGGQIRWVVCPAEDVGKIDEVEKGSVDLIIAAYAVSLLAPSQFFPRLAIKRKGSDKSFDTNRLTGSICPNSGLPRPRS